MTNIPTGAAPAPTMPVTFVDNPHAPDVFADSVSGIFLWQGNIRLTFEVARVNHVSAPGPVNRVVIGRLVLPISAAQNLRDLLTNYLDQWKAQETAQQVQAPPSSTLQ